MTHLAAGKAFAVLRCDHEAVEYLYKLVPGQRYPAPVTFRTGTEVFVAAFCPACVALGWALDREESGG